MCAEAWHFFDKKLDSRAMAAIAQMALDGRSTREIAKVADEMLARREDGGLREMRPQARAMLVYCIEHVTRNVLAYHGPKPGMTPVAVIFVQ